MYKKRGAVARESVCKGDRKLIDLSFLYRPGYPSKSSGSGKNYPDIKLVLTVNILRKSP